MLLNDKDKEYIKDNYSWLVIISDIFVEWVIRVNASYDNKFKKLILGKVWDNYIDKKYKISIKLFKNEFPSVYEVNWDLKRGTKYHIYDDWRFCITHTLFEKKYKNKNLKYIIENFIIPFLYNQGYYEKKWEYLWEYWHNFEWTFEYIFDNTISKEDYISVLQSIKIYIEKKKKIFIFSELERDKLINDLELKSTKSKKGVEKFIIYLRNHTNLFTKI